MTLSVDSDRARAHARQLADQHSEQREFLQTAHPAVPVEAFGQGLADYASSLAHDVTEIQDIGIRHAERLYHAAEDSLVLLNQLDSAEDINESQFSAAGDRP